MHRFLLAIAAALALLLPPTAAAEPADVDAAARGVVRVVVIGSDGENIYPVSHGTGFAVTPTKIVTNAHVLGEALEDDELRVGVVPGDGEDAVYAKVLAVSERNDLALLELTGSLRLPVLTIATSAGGADGEVSAVGYPMNVDRAQGLEIDDILTSQPAVKSRGFLSGARPSRAFDTVLHTAPIASGNSGGPLLDACGRVVGVNSFGTESDGSDAEFFFAVSTRELLPFLRRNGVQAQVTGLPCRSLAEIEAEERERTAAQQDAARDRRAVADAALQERRERMQLEAQLAVMESRENHMAAAFLLTLLGFAAGAAAWQLRGTEHGRRNVVIGGLVAGAATLGALAAWLTRPGLAEIDDRVTAALAGSGSPLADAGSADYAGTGGQFACRLDVERSRITGAAADRVDFSWQPDGCAQGSAQFGRAGDGAWRRVLAPTDSDAVTVQSFDPRQLDAGSGPLPPQPLRHAAGPAGRAGDRPAAMRPARCGGGAGRSAAGAVVPPAGPAERAGGLSLQSGLTAARHARLQSRRGDGRRAPASRGGPALAYPCACPFLVHFASLEEVRVETSAGIRSSLPGRYASALFDLAVEAGSVSAVEADLDKLEAALGESAELKALTTNPKVSRGAAQQALQGVSSLLGLNPLTGRFLGTLAQNRRLAQLSAIIRAFRDIASAQRGEVNAHVVSAHQLTEEQLAALRLKLTQREGRTVKLTSAVDPDLLGGLVVTVGSRRIDGSIRTRLNTLTKAMAHA